MFTGERKGKELTERDQNGANRFSFDGYGAFSSLVCIVPNSQKLFERERERECIPSGTL